MNYKKKNIGILALLACTLSTPVMAANVVENGDFEGKLSPWEFGSWNDSIASIAVDDGKVCIDITDPGTEVWMTQLRQNTMTYVDGNKYTLTADVWSSNPVSIKVDGSDEVGDDYFWHFGETFDIDAPLSGSPQKISAVFNNERDTTSGKLSFLMGYGLATVNTVICLDNVSLDDPDAVIVAGPGDIPVSPVRVNQHSYLPNFAKEATYVVPSDESATQNRIWQLQQGGSVVASGKTVNSGSDTASGDTIHNIDFSSVTTEADNYTLVVKGANADYVSLPFSIDADAYKDMQYDALAYFYHNRSSTPILASLVGDEHARDAGHPDDAVETAACATSPSSSACRTVDVSGGWYDAGDHGKYVVNGGISVWTLLNQFERSHNLGSNSSAFADGSMALPSSETSNGLPDLLDEVRWEIEWFLRMQAPAGADNSGMVHQKVHTNQWTAIPTTPADDNGTRLLQPVSTAATLNFAAVTAQCYRTYKAYDSSFANKCLSASKKAYSAAKASPSIDAVSAVDAPGSGVYGDSSYVDEFYWAATELYVSTGDSSYLSDMKGSTFHSEFFSGANIPSSEVPDDSMSWPNTQILGLISLAVAKEEFVQDSSMQSKAQDFLITRADHYVAESNKQGYGLPYNGKNAGWGSNSNVVNNMIIIGLANDFTCGTNSGYMDTMQKGMSYLLGNNPLDQSYITGYGERATQEPHHRFWAKAASSLYPSPPAGVLAGGPNRIISQDPIAKIDLVGCAPLKCYLDNIKSYATNEITINWNSPLAWVVAYMNEQSDLTGQLATEQRCTGSSSSSSSSNSSSSSSSSSSSGSSTSSSSSGGAISLIDLLAMLFLATAGLFARRHFKA